MSCGELIDKLATINEKLFVVQDELYEIRHMTLVEFKSKYSSDEMMEKLYNVFKKACDLNVNRNYLIFELDKKLIEVIDKRIAKEDKPGELAQDPHKIY